MSGQPDHMSETSPGPGWSEPARLGALRRYGILDTAREANFDEIVHVASIVCDAPIAVVNFIDERRQWFKAEQGLDIRETPLDVSICASAIREEGVFVVPDTTKDERFMCNPLVTGEPHLRFYAGARIDTPEGLPLGTVCVLDHEPRPDGLSLDQVEVLNSLARQVMTMLELRRLTEERDLLGSELRHRIKNIFAVVGGLVSASSRAYPEARNFVETLQGRLSALAKAQDYVRPAQESNVHVANPMTLHALIEAILAPYAERGGRLSLEGDDTEIGPGAATSLALILHEQATNAVKYGCLSTEDGRLAIACRLDGELFRLSWAEEGGPPVSPPQAQGFGSRLASRSVAQLDGEVRYDWRPHGLRLEIELATDRLQS